MFDFFETIDPKECRGGVEIHSTAIVSSSAEIGERVTIGPGAIIGPQVRLHDDVKIGAYASIIGRSQIGERTRIYPYTSIGFDPQDLKYGGQDTQVEIGTDNQIREYVNISKGTEKGGGITRIGNHNMIMTYSHFAHDCNIGSHCIFANGIQLAGHILVEDHVVFGGMSGGHQFCQFGEYAMIGAGAIVVQDVPPYCMVQGDRASVSGLNVVGLRRSGKNSQTLADIKAMFKILYKDALAFEEAIERIEERIALSHEREIFVDFLRRSERGICR